MVLSVKLAASWGVRPERPLERDSLVMIPKKLSDLRIVRFPDPILKRVAVPVTSFDASVAALGQRLLELMREQEGVGLAAPQVGIGLRLFVCNATGEPGDDLICINPRLSELRGAEEKTEGCLSLPNVNVTVRRGVKATMEAFDALGVPFERTDEGLAARIWQHEVDHLDGRLIIDSMSSTDELTNRRFLKQLRDDYATAKRRVGR